MWDPALPENEPSIPAEHKLSPAARQLLVEAFERDPLHVVVLRIVTVLSGDHWSTSSNVPDAENAARALRERL